MAPAMSAITTTPPFRQHCSAVTDYRGAKPLIVSHLSLYLGSLTNHTIHVKPIKLTIRAAKKRSL